MRYVRVAHFIYIICLGLMDLVVNAIFGNIPSLRFVTSNMALIGLVVLTKTDSLEDSLWKGFFVAMWLELSHLGSFPIFIISYAAIILLTHAWNRHIGSSMLEILVQVMVALFLKEIIIWLLLPIIKNTHYDFIYFVSSRVFGTIVVNLLFVPWVVYLNQVMHSIILKRQSKFSSLL